MVSSLLPVVQTVNAPEHRAAIYAMGKKVCIDAARGNTN